MIALGRRAALLGGAGVAIASVQRGRAAEQVLTIGMSVPLTGALARQSEVVRTGAQFAVDQANAKGGIAGHRIQLTVLDDDHPQPDNTTLRSLPPMRDACSMTPR